MHKSNKVFSSRADEMTSFTSFDSFENDSEERIKRRRPDRILGFQETGSFIRRLEKYNLMAGRSENEAGVETIWKTVESTILNHKGNSLLFPFLIIEAKSRIGASFEDCNMQSALPILKMLKIQEDLQRKSRTTLEYGGPLVWYIAYRCEDWHLSGCYISEKPGGPSYASPTPTMVCDIANLYQEIVTLWTGQLNDVESALQLLLIIDYIFDWARDIYKPSLISQLEMLANEPPVDDGPIRDDDFTRIETDSDIFSLARPRTIEDWGATLEDDTEMVPDEERSLMKWATHDSEFGVFRPACIVQNLFRCLFVTKTNIDELFSAVKKPYTVKQLARQVAGALDSYSTVLVSEDVLDVMEEVWTNRARLRTPRHIPETRLFASIVYHTVVTYQWELQRIIYCLAFDGEALSKVKGYTQQKGPPSAFKNAKRFGKANAEALTSALKYQAIQENLASALASTRQELSKSAGTSAFNPCPTFEFVDKNYVPNGWTEKKTYEIIDKVYHWCEKNSEEPTEPFLRVSHQWNSLRGSSTSSTVASYFPNSIPTNDEQYVLVTQDRYYKSFCIYAIPGLTEATEQLRKSLLNAARNGVLYQYSLRDHISNSWKDVYKKWRTTDSRSCQEIIKRFRQWRHEMQDKVSPSPPVALSAAGKAEPRPVERQSLLPEIQPSCPSSPLRTPPSSSVPVAMEAESNLKRPREDADRNDVLTIQKKAKSQIIIIDD
jgi:hypothetical protein